MSQIDDHPETFVELMRRFNLAHCKIPFGRPKELRRLLHYHKKYVRQIKARIEFVLRELSCLERSVVVPRQYAKYETKKSDIVTWYREDLFNLRAILPAVESGVAQLEALIISNKRKSAA